MTDDLVKKLVVDGREFRFYDVCLLGKDYDCLPYCLRVIVECLLRKGHQAKGMEASAWKDSIRQVLESAFQQRDMQPKADQKSILFQPGRVLLQDFTGVPALIDLAAVRDIIAEKGGDPKLIDSMCPADLVVDHTVQVDYSQIVGSAKSKKKAAAFKEQSKKDDASANTLVEQGGSLQAPLTTPPTIVMHSNFPPPSFQTSGAYYYPASNLAQVQSFSLFPSNAPLSLYSLPATVPTAQQPIFYQTNPYHIDTSAGLSHKKSNTHNAVDSFPTDNPGLPIQDEICPFHQRISFWSDMLHKNEEQEFKKNAERFEFLKWVNYAFKNITVIPPGTGIMHQVNLEYLARIVTCQEGLLFPDSLIGTDCHTTMINGLGVLGWCVGTMDAESVMFGHPISMVVPKVIGVKLEGNLPKYATSTEIVLLITKRLRHAEEVRSNFIEFFGSGVEELSIADRATVANMCPEYGALIGYFPVDETTLKHLESSGRDRSKVDCIKAYLEQVKMLRSKDDPDPVYNTVIVIDLGDVQPCLSGPKRSKDKIAVKDVASAFRHGLVEGYNESRGFGLPPEQVHLTFSVNIDGCFHSLTHGAVLLAAITSCSNTTNPSVMMGAGLLAKKAIENGLSVAKYVKTSLSPGSGVITSYLQESGVMPYFHMLGFEIVGYGCSTCVENNKPIPESIIKSIKQGNLICCGIMSGNRNFEGRIQPDIKANYLASPMLVIAYAIAGRVDIDLENEPIGYNAKDEPVFLKDIWPSRKEIQDVENRFVIPAIFRQVFARISFGNKHWSSLTSPDSNAFPWNSKSSFIQPPLYLKEIFEDLKCKTEDKLMGMRCLIKVGNNVTSDHISPAGSIVRNSPAAEYLASLGLSPREYNSYGSRRGNCNVMMRGTFAHLQIKNELSGKSGPYTIHLPSEVPTTIFDAAQKYKREDVPLLVVAGQNFGCGAPRDWATKGPLLLGIRAVLAISFDPTYRSNLVKTGILPLEIDETTFEILTGREKIDILLPKLDRIKRSSDIVAQIVLNGEFELEAKVRLDNAYEVSLFMSGGVISQLLKKSLPDPNTDVATDKVAI